MRTKYVLVGVLVGVLFSVTAVVLAGNLDPAYPPTSTSSYTLEDIYNRLNAGTAGSESTFTEPSSGPGTGTMHTLNEIMDAAPDVDDAGGAAPGEVLAGKTYWGLRSGAWGPQVGTAAAGNDVNGPEGARTFSIPDGFYWGKTATANDANLVASNIKQGVNLFGETGTLAAPVPKTGQTERYDDGDDGDLEKGVAWPNPRFTDNGNGTVTDNLTGLIWLKNANCFGLRTWATALNDANWLDSGDDVCDLSDSSAEGDWRLPNVRELHSLIDYGRAYNPDALPSDRPFSDVQSDYYWSSTTHASYTDWAWVVYLGAGFVVEREKTSTYYVWPVRDGQ